MAELAFWSMAAVAQAIRGRELSPVEVFDAVAKQIESRDPLVNAYCAKDLEGARSAAVQAQERLLHDEAIGPLHGVPIAIKDDLAVEGLPYTCGCRLLKKHVAEYDDLTVTRLRKAGAIILGKTNLPEFGHKGTTDNLLFGATRNPWHLGCTAGGSSGGSAAAVASGMAYLALGTDIGGSIRIPASCCGIVGLKPSLGRIPRVPAGNYFNSAWVSGPMARSTEDVALALSILAGPDPRDPYSLAPLRDGELRLDADLRGLRIGWSQSPTGQPVEPSVAEAAKNALKGLEREGAVVEPMERTLDAPRKAIDILLSGECLSMLTLLGAGSRWRFAVLGLLGFVSPRFRLSPTFLPFARRGVRIGLRHYLEAQAEITAFVEKSAAEFFAEFDLVATPTLALPPFSHELPLGPDCVASQSIDPHLGWLFTWPFNLTGQPAVSIPCGQTPDGLPLGLQLVGRRGADGLVLRAAAALERAGPWIPREPTFRAG